MKKLCLLFQIFILFSLGGYAQKTTRLSAVSPKTYISIGKEPAKPPYLEIRKINFEDNDGNKIIDAGENCFIRFQLINSGLGPGTGLSVSVSEINQIEGLQFENSLRLPDLQEKDSSECLLSISGHDDLKTGTAVFKIRVSEAGGFHSDPVQIEITTEAFREPLVRVVDYQVSSQSSGKLEKRKPFDLELLVQNLGQGIANDVSINLVLPQNVFCLTANDFETIGILQPGEKKIVAYNIVTNNEYDLPEIDIELRLKEKYGRYAEDKTIKLTMNQNVSDEKLVVESVAVPKASIEVASLTSDIDRNIPETGSKNPYKVALIIGNENYSGLNSEVNVEYARRDAETFRNYALKALGVEERNVRFLTDATAGAMKREIDLVTELVRRLGKEAELIFFYAGHGYPDEKERIPYLIPVDVNASDLSSALSLQEVYRKFSALDAKKVTVVLDACFSGGGRNQGLLTARAVRIKPKEEVVSGNMVVFTASSGDQTALPYHDQKHGMFSYFLMKKLQESNGKAGFGEIYNYLKEKVGIESLRINGKIQDPTVITSPMFSETWQNMTF